jgi:protein ImuB
VRLLSASDALPKIAAAEPANVSTVATRPILLLPEPERVEVVAVHPDGPPHRITLRGQTRSLVVALGPERFETAWNDGPEARRDYWRVETDDAQRLWLYRCRRGGGWFLHGMFG